MNVAVDFNKEKHQYTKQGLIYTSVTKIVSSFCHPFDGEYWSLYKAIKDITIQEKGEVGWIRHKRLVGGWKSVVDYYKKNGSLSNKAIQTRKAEYLQSWDVTGHNARTVGTAVHNAREQELTKKKTALSESGDSVVLEVTQGQLLSTQDFKSNRIYPELIISNDEFQVAGTSDKVEKIGQLVHVSDYKTSKEIEKEAFDNQMMFPPVNLPDCNFYHYTMQLSLYGWMLQEQGYKVGKLTIEQLFAPKFEKKDVKFHDLPYRPDLVRPMLEEYRRKNPVK